MSRILLDTHVLIWWVEASSRVKASWVDAILDPDNSIHVSAASAWEIETKKRIGKLHFAHDVGEIAASFGFEHLGVTMSHAAAAGSMQWQHGDPFDRMLVAQAVANDMLFITSDQSLKSAPGVRVL
jgi:PIN domain nuclease of toxin-antitoxin system